MGAEPARAGQFPPAVANALAGKRFGLIGFDQVEADRALHALEDVHAFGRTFEPSTVPPASPEARSIFDICVLKLNGAVVLPETHRAIAGDRPLLLVGSRAQIAERNALIANPYSDFVIVPWSSEELIMRAYHLLSVAQVQTGETTAGLPRRNAAATGPPKALVADDDLATSVLISTALKSQGFDVTTARDGGEALELAHNKDLSILVLDINMPTLSGFEVLSALQAEGAMSRVPVLVVSNRHQEADIVRAFALGAVDYVTKPFSPLELAARARRILAI